MDRFKVKERYGKGLRYPNIIGYKALDKRVYQVRDYEQKRINIFVTFSMKTYVVGTH